MSSVTFDVAGHVARIQLDRPRALNAIDRGMDAELAAAWARVDADPDIRVAILSATGERAFCAGADLSDPPTGASGLSFGGGLTGIGGALVRMRKPLIAAVHGHVLGLGFELALCADVIVAAEDTVFRLPEARGGFIAQCGVVHRAIRQLPHHVALAMIIASEPLDAAGALQFGLVADLVPFEKLGDTAEAWARKILDCSPLASQAGKAAAIAGLNVDLEQALAASYHGIEAYAASADAREAAAAWAARRPAIWQGR